MYHNSIIINYIPDINECTENPCDQNCTNTVGSFTCSCNNGYELDRNNRSCNGMYNVYMTYGNCLLLYILCIDIDECLSGPCASDLICNNMDGSYSCDCPDGTMRNGTDCICKCNIYHSITIRNQTDKTLITSCERT